MGELLAEDLSLLQDAGLDRLGHAAQRLRHRYGGLEHPAAREIMAWLDGAYSSKDELADS
jgi:hypothetical protein